MVENVDNIVLEQLRLIREKLSEVENKIDGIKTGQDGHTGILVALGGYIHSIDERVEHLEQRIGGA